MQKGINASFNCYDRVRQGSGQVTGSSMYRITLLLLGRSPLELVIFILFFYNIVHVHHMLSLAGSLLDYGHAFSGWQLHAVLASGSCKSFVGDVAFYYRDLASLAISIIPIHCWHVLHVLKTRIKASFVLKHLTDVTKFLFNRKFWNQDPEPIDTDQPSGMQRSH